MHLPGVFQCCTAILGVSTCHRWVSDDYANFGIRYLQAALYAGMNGRAGLAAWQWLFIFDGMSRW